MINDELLERIEKIRSEDKEYLTFLIMDSKVVYGIVQNETPKIMMFYDATKLTTEEEKKIFFKFADEWWYMSNHMIPIESFIGERFNYFHKILKGYPKKGIKQIVGPTFSMEQYSKRIKKRKIEFLKPKST